MVTEQVKLRSCTKGLELAATLIYPDEAAQWLESANAAYESAPVTEVRPRKKRRRASESDAAYESCPFPVVQLVHGMAEHKERYYPFMEYLSGRGCITIIADNRGHGESVKSPDDLGFFYNGGIDALMDDIARVGEYATEKFHAPSRHLFGHSMGSLAARVYAGRHDDELASLIICGSPSQTPAAPFGIFLTSLMSVFMGDRHRSKLLTKIAFGHNNDRFTGTSANRWLSKNESNVAAYDADPLCGFTFTLDGYNLLFRLLRETYSPAAYDLQNPALPILFISGADDPCAISPANFTSSTQFLRDLGYPSISSHLYPTLRHELLNENETRIFESVGDFIVGGYALF